MGVLEPDKLFSGHYWEAKMKAESGKCEKCGAQRITKAGTCKRCRMNGFH
ncbi:MAG TPA: hypothetical protein VJC00_01835 [Candidatus Nanoarchaeia archaeon]|nr:hypothetical protein [Candidatus Nanoarchaeia archaeon]